MLTIRTTRGASAATMLFPRDKTDPVCFGLVTGQVLTDSIERQAE